MHPPDACAARSRRPTSRRSCRCPASARRAPSGYRARAEGPARVADGRHDPRRAAGLPASDGGRTLAGAGTRRWSVSAGRTRRPRRRSPARPRRGDRRHRVRRGRRAAPTSPLWGGLRAALRDVEPRMTRASSGAVDGTSARTPALPDPGTRQVVESALRPATATEFIGQPRVPEQLALVLEGAQRRGRPPDHVLLSGPPGPGQDQPGHDHRPELGASVKITSGPAIEHSGDLAAMLSTLSEGDVLFIDEIHRIARPAEEMLYMAMEDYRVDVVVGKGPGPRRSRWRSPVHAGRRHHPAGLLTGPLRDRFGFVGAHGVLRTGRAAADPPPQPRPARRRTLMPRTAAEIAGRSRGTPRIANRLLRRVRDYAEVKGDGTRRPRGSPRALARLRGRRARARPPRPRRARCARARFSGGPVGVATLAVAVGEEPETVEEVAEPFLVRCGLLARTPRGRVATAAAWRHLGYPLPAGGAVAGRGPVAPPAAPAAHRRPRVRRQSPCSTHRLPVAGAQLVRPRPRVRPVVRAPCTSGNEATDAPERSHPGPHPPRSLRHAVRGTPVVGAVLSDHRPRASGARAVRAARTAAQAPAGPDAGDAGVLTIGTPVMTTSGLHGTVAALGDTTVDLEIAPGVVVTLARQAILEVRTPGHRRRRRRRHRSWSSGATGGRSADGTV